MNMRSLLFLFASLFLFVVGLIVGCKDFGSEPQLLQSPFGIAEETVFILINRADTLKIVGGTPPYRVLLESDTARAKARILGDSLLRIEARVVGWSTIIIGDSSSPEQKDTVRSFVYSVSYSAEVQPIFTTNCALSGCHVTGGPAPFSLETGVSRGFMVGIDAETGPCRPILRVKAGFSNSSALYLRIEGNCGQQMPIGGGGALPVTQRSKIKDWIDEGALPN